MNRILVIGELVIIDGINDHTCVRRLCGSLGSCEPMLQEYYSFDSGAIGGAVRFDVRHNIAAISDSDGRRPVVLDVKRQRTAYTTCWSLGGRLVRLRDFAALPRWIAAALQRYSAEAIAAARQQGNKGLMGIEIALSSKRAL
jgi:hypothetical protein